MKQFKLTPKDSYGYQRITKGDKILPNVFVSNNIEPNTMLMIDHDAEISLKEVRFKPFRSGVMKNVGGNHDQS